ncbi:hypothetical protein FQN57_001566 [Myotisia sp. PD_48]|nr:hypothetical protein FQN57_001566 [Myotisia sp. PD_48]
MALRCTSTETNLHSQSQSWDFQNCETRQLVYAPKEEPKIPAPAIFEDEALQETGICPVAERVIQLPTAAECAVHLELLETFYVLRQRVLKSDSIDKTFGIYPIHQLRTGVQGDTKKLKDETLWTRRQVKWQKYLILAVARFLTWCRRLDQLPENEMRISEENLPPLDVILVWHSFLLNPSLYRKQCSDSPVYRLTFPWAAVHHAIDNHDWTFCSHPGAAAYFMTLTGLEYDLSQQLSTWHGIISPAAPVYYWTSLINGIDFTKPPGVPQWLETLCNNDLKKNICLHLKICQDIDAPLAADLKAAVIRQQSFAEKMNARLWIRSPALEGTLRRAIGRYDKFLILFKMYPRTTLVPTLDIDLVWHTHQCSALAYFESTKQRTGRFLNHDDSISSSKLGTGLRKTSELFRIRFGQEYAMCDCWDCHALASALDVNFVTERVGDVRFSIEKIAKRVMEDVRYHRTVEARRRMKLSFSSQSTS